MKKKKRWIVGLLAIGLLCKSPEPIQAETKWPEGISISSGSACVIEVNTGTVLYEKNATDKSYPASITKVLTVDVALENAQLDETVVFSEFSNALSNPVILGIVNFAPLPGSIIIELAPNLGFAMIDRMLGGQGQPLDKPRDFSEIELSIISKILIMCMQLMKEPWKNVVDVEPFLDRIETNPQFAQIIAPNDMIAIVTLNVKIGDVEGFMNVCLPFFTVEDVMDKLNTKFWYSTMQDASEEDYSYYVESMIRRAQVPLKAVLGESTITVNDFVNLQRGDIIKLNKSEDSEMSIYVGNIKKFMAVPGKSGDKYAIRVTDVIREEE